MSSTVFLTHAKTRLRAAGIPSYALDAELLLAHTLGISREKVIGYRDLDLTAEQQEAYNTYITRRESREPISHILGKREFWGREFKVTKDTLDPRPDSETLVEAVLSHYKHQEPPKKILDLGTGTGCLLLTLLAEFPGSYGVGVDISPAALEVAKTNTCQLGLEKHVQLLLQCWAEGIEETFDVVISNPPYIRDDDIPGLEPEVSRYEPGVALAGGEDGFQCYRQLVPQLPGLLSARGMAVLEIGVGQAEYVSRLLRTNHLDNIEVYRDLAGAERCIVANR